MKRQINRTTHEEKDTWDSPGKDRHVTQPTKNNPTKTNKQFKQKINKQTKIGQGDN